MRKEKTDVTRNTTTPKTTVIGVHAKVSSLLERVTGGTACGRVKSKR
jgi:hypothetical protein